MQRLHLGQRSQAVGRLADDVETLRLQQGARGITEALVVVDNQHSAAHSPPCFQNPPGAHIVASRNLSRRRFHLAGKTSAIPRDPRAEGGWQIRPPGPRRTSVGVVSLQQSRDGVAERAREHRTMLGQPSTACRPGASTDIRNRRLHALAETDGGNVDRYE